MKVESMSSAIDLLRQYGIRPSHQRITVLNYLLDHREHNSADEIFEGLYKQVPTLSRTTVFNTLRLFRDLGVVQAVSIGTNPVCFDVDMTPHAHFYCSECHSITDIPITDEDWFAVKKYGGDGVDMQVTFHGLCDRCLSHRR